MAWIKQIDPAEATGLLKKQYDAAFERAGKVYNIIRISSLKPHFIRDYISLYVTLMKGKGVLRRAQREMIAVVVSRANDCFY